jgi:hypothetical protein
MPPRNQVKLCSEDLTVEMGSHILLLYQNESELLETLSGYFREGLRNNNLCILIGSSRSLIKLLAKNIENILLARGEKLINPLIFVKSKEFYFSKGGFDADAIYNKIDQSFEKNALKGMRGASDMAWVDKGFNEISKYEAGLTERYHDKNVLLLCAYPIKGLMVEQIQTDTIPYANTV